MPGASGLSKREELERLMEELRRLSPGAREAEFKKWRTRAHATMSDLFGPRHKLTLALRDVTFTADFGQGRSRALALLRSASSLATAPPESKAAPAWPATTAVPDWPDATAELPGIVATAETSGTANDDAGAEPTATPDHDAVAQPMLDTPAEPMPDAIDAKHETIFRRIVRKRDFSGERPAIPDEPTDMVGSEAPRRPVVGPRRLLGEPATPQTGPAFAAELSGTAELPGIVATAGTSGAANDDAGAEPTGATDHDDSAQPVLDTPAEPAPHAIEPKNETIFRRIAWKRDSHGTHPASAAELTEASEQPMPETAAEPTPEAAISPPGTPAFAPAAEAAVDAEPAAVAESAPAAETAVPKLGTTSQESGASWTPRATAGRSDTSGTPQTVDREFDTFRMASAISRGPTWGEPRASRRPKRRLRRLTIAAIVIVFLGLAVAFPVWLVWFGGWSTMSGLWSTTATSTATSLANPSTIGVGANVRVVDVTGDPRSAYIVEVVRAGIVQLVPNETGEVFFLPAKLVGRGEFLTWLDRVRRIPAGSREVPDAFYYDLDPPFRNLAIGAYQRRIVLEWPDEDMKIAFNAADAIRAGDAEAWAARMIIGLLSTTTLQSALGITEADALDLRARISSLKAQELATVVEGFRLGPEAGWAKEESISRSEAAEFLMRLKAALDRYLVG